MHIRRTIWIFCAIILVLIFAYILWDIQRGNGRRGANFITLSNLAEIGKALRTFNQDVGRYRSTREGLNALLNPPPGAANWKGPYIQSEKLHDAWGHAYIYRSPAPLRMAPYDVFSAGAIGIPDDGDDLFPRDDLFPTQKNQ